MPFVLKRACVHSCIYRDLRGARCIYTRLFFVHIYEYILYTYLLVYHTVPASPSAPAAIAIAISAAYYSHVGGWNKEQYFFPVRSKAPSCVLACQTMENKVKYFCCCSNCLCKVDFCGLRLLRNFLFSELLFILFHSIPFRCSLKVFLFCCCRLKQINS